MVRLHRFSGPFLVLPTVMILRVTDTYPAGFLSDRVDYYLASYSSNHGAVA